MVQLDQKATKEIRVIKDLPEQMVQLDQKATPVIQEPQAHKDLPEQMVQLDQKATPVNKAYKDLLVMMEP
jgi:hypothetical protein